MVDKLPRNDTGKLPRDVLQSLLSRVGTETRKPPSSGTASLPIAADHPAFAGHFPGNPIVPGVVLLDEVLYAIGKMIGLDTSVCQISAIKFFSPVRPGETVSVAYQAQPGVASTDRIRLRSRAVSARSQQATSLCPVNSAETAPIASNAAKWHARPERGSMLMLRVISWISLRLGRPAGRVFLRLIAGYFLLFAPAARAASRLYLSRSPFTTGGVAQHLQAFFLVRLDDLRPHLFIEPAL